MIRAKNDPFNIDTVYDWEESDKIVAQTLSFETEQHLLELAREIRATILSKPLHLPEQERERVEREELYLRGKYDLLLFLVEQSKEAKVQAHLV